MKKVIIDGGKLKDKNQVFVYFMKKFREPDYFAPTFGCFWDYLMSVREPMHIVIYNGVGMHITLKGFAECLLELFTEADKRNENITFEYID